MGVIDVLKRIRVDLFGFPFPEAREKSGKGGALDNH